MQKSKWIFVILFLSLSMLSFDRLIGFAGNSKNKNFAEKVNLALRRTAHRLLKSSGDSTSQIEPVKTFNESTFVVRLNKNFKYDNLPQLLEESFKLHQIEDNYDVSVLNCKDGELELGYNYLDFKKDKDVACVGRKQDKNCYDLKVTFREKSIQNTSKSLWLIPLWGLFLGGFIYWKRKNLEEKNEPKTITETELSEKINFGNSSLNFSNQILNSGNVQHNLTYREAKLLKLFVDNSNQLLERDFIMKAIWEDEGITVGRSLDVFVSRLRKMLQADENVQIVTSHGVGYKLQVVDN
jgi:DNA-binding winged helix-turn-helix (wHTH) protein